MVQERHGEDETLDAIRILSKIEAPCTTRGTCGTMRFSDLSSLGNEYAEQVRTSFGNHFHVASLYVRGTLVARATNRVGSRKRGAGFSDFTIHAERAVLKLIDHSLLKDAELVVVRINAQGHYLSSKPCHSCQRALTAAMKKWGLRKVWYS